eukprot:15351357-Ditylum_brightwellii.AAC.2
MASLWIIFGLFDASYASAETPDYVPAEDGFSDDVSLLSVRDDDFNYIISFCSVLAGRTVAERDNRASIKTGTYHRYTKMEMPCLLEE